MVGEALFKAQSFRHARVGDGGLSGLDRLPSAASGAGLSALDEDEDVGESAGDAEPMETFPQMMMMGHASPSALASMIAPHAGVDAAKLLTAAVGAADAATQRSLRQQCARALRDLSKQPGNRLRILAHDAHAAIVTLLDDTTSTATRVDCAVALANLSALQPRLADFLLRAAAAAGVAVFPLPGVSSGALASGSTGAGGGRGVLFSRPDIERLRLASVESPDGAGSPIMMLASTTAHPGQADGGSSGLAGPSLIPAQGVVLALGDIIRGVDEGLPGDDQVPAGHFDLTRPGPGVPPASSWLLRATAAVALFNHTTALEARSRVASEMAAETLADMLRPRSLVAVDTAVRGLATQAAYAQAAHDASSSTLRRATAGNAILDEAAASVTARDVATDAVVVPLALAGLCNMAACPGPARRAVLSSSALSNLRSVWFVLPPALRATAAARLIEPMTRHTGAINRLATSGIVAPLVDAVRTAYGRVYQEIRSRVAQSVCDEAWDPDARIEAAGAVAAKATATRPGTAPSQLRPSDASVVPPSAGGGDYDADEARGGGAGDHRREVPAELLGSCFVLRRCLLALSRLTQTRQAVQRFTRSYGGRALAEAVTAAVFLESSELAVGLLAGIEVEDEDEDERGAGYGAGMETGDWKASPRARKAPRGSVTPFQALSIITGAEADAARSSASPEDRRTSEGSSDGGSRGVGRDGRDRTDRSDSGTRQPVAASSWSSSRAPGSSAADRHGVSPRLSTVLDRASRQQQLLAASAAVSIRRRGGVLSDGVLLRKGAAALARVSAALDAPVAWSHGAGVAAALILEREGPRTNLDPSSRRSVRLVLHALCSGLGASPLVPDTAWIPEGGPGHAGVKRSGTDDARPRGVKDAADMAVMELWRCGAVASLLRFILLSSPGAPGLLREDIAPLDRTRSPASPALAGTSRTASSGPGTSGAAAGPSFDEDVDPLMTAAAAALFNASRSEAILRAMTARPAPSAALPQPRSAVTMPQEESRELRAVAGSHSGPDSVEATLRAGRARHSVLPHGAVGHRVGDMPAAAVRILRIALDAVNSSSPSKRNAAMAETAEACRARAGRDSGRLADGSTAPPFLSNAVRAASFAVAALRNMTSADAGALPATRRLVIRTPGLLDQLLRLLKPRDTDPFLLIQRAFLGAPKAPSSSSLAGGGSGDASGASPRSRRPSTVKLQGALNRIRTRRASGQAVVTLDQEEDELDGELSRAAARVAASSARVAEQAPVPDEKGTRPFIVPPAAARPSDMPSGWERVHSEMRPSSPAPTPDLPLPPLPLTVAADAIAVLGNLVTGKTSRRLVAAAGAIPCLVPIAAKAPMSSLAVCRAFSMRLLRLRHWDALTIEEDRQTAIQDAADAAEGARPDAPGGVAAPPVAAVSAGSSAASLVASTSRSAMQPQQPARARPGSPGGPRTAATQGAGGRRGRLPAQGADQAAAHATSGRGAPRSVDTSVGRGTPGLSGRGSSRTGRSPAGPKPRQSPRSRMGQAEFGVLGIDGDVSPVLVAEQLRLERLATTAREGCAVGLTLLATDMAWEAQAEAERAVAVGSSGQGGGRSWTSGAPPSSSLHGIPRPDSARSTFTDASGGTQQQESGTPVGRLSSSIMRSDDSSAVVFRAGILRALRALAQFGGDGATIQLHVARALRMLSSAPGVGAELVREGIIPVVLSLAASTRPAVRRESTGTLFNLSVAEATAQALLAEGALGTIVALALVRCRDAVSQTLCVLAVHNLLSHQSSRWRVLTMRLEDAGDAVGGEDSPVGPSGGASPASSVGGGGPHPETEAEAVEIRDSAAVPPRDRSAVIWMLQRLCLSPYVSVQRACALTMRRLADESACRNVLVEEGGLRSVVHILLRSAEGADEPGVPQPPPTPSSSVQARRRASNARGSAASHAPLPTPRTAARNKAQQDSHVGALLAGVLGAVSRETGHEETLVREGAVDALVLLASSGAQGRDAEAQAKAFAATGSGGGDSGADPLKAACALGLCNLAASPDASVRRRVIDGGAVDVFVGLGSGGSSAEPARSLSLLGLCHLLWAAGPSTQRAVLNAGAARVFTRLAVVGASQGHAFAAAVCLHACSCSRALVAPMIADGGVTALTAILRRVADASPDELAGVIGRGSSHGIGPARPAAETAALLADTAALALGAAANLAMSRRGTKAVAMTARGRAEVEARRGRAVARAHRHGEAVGPGLLESSENGGLSEAAAELARGTCLAAAVEACDAVCAALSLHHSDCRAGANGAHAETDDEGDGDGDDSSVEDARAGHRRGSLRPACAEVLEVLRVAADECAALLLAFSRHPALTGAVLRAGAVKTAARLLACPGTSMRARTRAAATVRNLSVVNAARLIMLDPLDEAGGAGSRGSAAGGAVAAAIDALRGAGDDQPTLRLGSRSGHCAADVLVATALGQDGPGSDADAAPVAGGTERSESAASVGGASVPSLAEEAGGGRAEEEPDGSLDIFLPFARDILDGVAVTAMDPPPEDPSSRRVGGIIPDPRGPGATTSVRPQSTAGSGTSGGGTAVARGQQQQQQQQQQLTGHRALSSAAQSRGTPTPSFGAGRARETPQARHLTARGRRLSSVFFATDVDSTAPQSPSGAGKRGAGFAVLADGSGLPTSRQGTEALGGAAAATAAQGRWGPGGDAELVARQRSAAQVGFLRRMDAVKALCNLTRDPRSHDRLKEAGAASAFLSVSDDPLCSKQLRTACLRGLCELSIERDDDAGQGAAPPQGGSPARPATPDATDGGTTGGHSPSARAAASDVVSAGAVSALLAMMANREETADDLAEGEKDSSTPEFGMLPSDAALCHPNTRTASLPHPGLYEGASLRLGVAVPAVEAALATQSSLTDAYKSRLVREGGRRRQQVAEAMANGASPVHAAASAAASDPPPILGPVHSDMQHRAVARAARTAGPRGARWSVGFQPPSHGEEHGSPPQAGGRRGGIGSGDATPSDGAASPPGKPAAATGSPQHVNDSGAGVGMGGGAIITRTPPPAVAAALGLGGGLGRASGAPAGFAEGDPAASMSPSQTQPSRGEPGAGDVAVSARGGELRAVPPMVMAESSSSSALSGQASIVPVPAPAEWEAITSPEAVGAPPLASLSEPEPDDESRAGPETDRSLSRTGSRIGKHRRFSPERMSASMSAAAGGGGAKPALNRYGGKDLPGDADDDRYSAAGPAAYPPLPAVSLAELLGRQHTVSEVAAGRSLEAGQSSRRHGGASVRGARGIAVTAAAAEAFMSKAMVLEASRGATSARQSVGGLSSLDGGASIARSDSRPATGASASSGSAYRGLGGASKRRVRELVSQAVSLARDAADAAEAALDDSDDEAATAIGQPGPARPTSGSRSLRGAAERPLSAAAMIARRTSADATGASLGSRAPQPVSTASSAASRADGRHQRGAAPAGAPAARGHGLGGLHSARAARSSTVADSAPVLAFDTAPVTLLPHTAPDVEGAAFPLVAEPSIVRVLVELNGGNADTLVGSGNAKPRRRLLGVRSRPKRVPRPRPPRPRAARPAGPGAADRARPSSTPASAVRASPIVVGGPGGGDQPQRFGAALQRPSSRGSAVSDISSEGSSDGGAATTGIQWGVGGGRDGTNPTATAVLSSGAAADYDSAWARPGWQSVGAVEGLTDGLDPDCHVALRASILAAMLALPSQRSLRVTLHETPRATAADIVERALLAQTGEDPGSPSRDVTTSDGPAGRRQSAAPGASLEPAVSAVRSGSRRAASRPSGGWDGDPRAPEAASTMPRRRPSSSQAAMTLHASPNRPGTLAPTWEGRGRESADVLEVGAGRPREGSVGSAADSESSRAEGGAGVVVLATQPDGTTREVKLWPGDAGYSEMAFQLFLDGVRETEEVEEELKAESRSPRQHRLDSRGVVGGGVRSLRPPSGAVPPSLAAMPSTRAPGYAAHMRQRLELAVQSVDDDGIRRRALAQALREDDVVSPRGGGAGTAPGPRSSVGSAPPPSPIRADGVRARGMAASGEMGGADDFDERAALARAAEARRRADLRSAYAGVMRGRQPHGGASAAGLAGGRALRAWEGKSAASASPRSGPGQAPVPVRRSVEGKEAEDTKPPPRPKTRGQIDSRLAARQGLLPARPTLAGGRALLGVPSAWAAKHRPATSSHQPGRGAAGTRGSGRGAGSSGAHRGREAARAPSDSLSNLLQAAAQSGIRGPEPSSSGRGEPPPQAGAAGSGGVGRRGGTPQDGGRAVAAQSADVSTPGRAGWRSLPPTAAAAASRPGSRGVPSHGGRSFFPRSGLAKPRL